MSDPTKKSIVINKAFLSGSENSGSSHTQNKKSKKNTRNLSEEIIKPNKLKKMLLDKINAKRKAEHTSPASSLGISSNNANTLDVSKETKIFSSEFKKSLDFLDSYIGQKKTDRYNQKTKTLKKQSPSSPSTSLNSDILKSLHSNNITPNTHASYASYASHPTNNINQSLPPQGYVTQPMQYQQQQRISPPVAPPVAAPLHRQQQTPLFQKIELQIPNKPTHNISPNILPNTVPKINLAIGKPANSTFVYTELPPELQNFTPPVYNISSPSLSSLSAAEAPMMLDSLPQLDVYNKPIGAIDSREMSKIDYNNSELVDMETSMETNMETSMENDKDLMNMIESSSTSLFPTSTTFSPIKLSDDTPYGCLKDGKKPTFRMYNKTIKNNTRFSDDESNQDSTYSERQTKLKELKNKHNKKASTLSQNGNTENKNENENDNSESGNNENRNSHSLRKTKIRRRLRKTITKKFKLGKQAGNIVGVWIKNNDTRKNIQKEQGLLKSKQLGEVKKYLVEKNLIKIGSTAPPGVIRNIYEASMLSGEVENIGKGVGLHNFLEDKKSW
jgi:hypothetical protein